MTVLVLDNYDSFTYNLVQMIGQLGIAMVIKRNNQITLEEAEAINPNRIVISPGPGTPEKAGISKQLIKHFGDTIPILGVCLGHQCLAEAFGGKVQRAAKPVHGKVSTIYHQQKGIFRGIPDPFKATRYHSLIVSRENLPEQFSIIAETAEGEIMALKHQDHPLWGLQFHPESILTKEGPRLISNFFDI